ncbi:LutC/YkgG family protein [Solimonas variicoloris]|uniref:LutC/YkgG family protein n=1 Tax=Solimonas variicoloris TaxID=254408 RepID=UPI0003638910|nr:lactate utilization protein [Solimonas variicoloris]
MSGVAAEQRARAAIFARLRAAPDVEPVAIPDVAGYYRNRAAPSGESRRERFLRNARSWRAEVIETTVEDWPAALAAVLDARNVQRLLAGRGTSIADTLAARLPAGRLRWYDAPLASFKAELFGAIDAGITTTLGSVAETGSLLLWPDAAEPRTLSLVPPLHIAVLRESGLHETLFDAVAGQGWAARMPSNALLVTGPSKTADIQRMLVYGAHGPRELVILLLRDGDAA